MSAVAERLCQDAHRSMMLRAIRSGRASFHSAEYRVRSLFCKHRTEELVLRFSVDDQGFLLYPKLFSDPLSC